MMEVIPKANADQMRAWDGADGDNWTENEEFYNATARLTTPRLFDAAAIEPAERVIDIGCGAGETTRLAARTAAGAFGIDLSGRMIGRARERATAEGVTNVRFEQGDAQIYPFEPQTFQVAISRFGAMFFDEPVRAFTNIARALAPGGRMVLLCWREVHRNEWLTALRAALSAGRDLPVPPPTVPSPFALADPERVRTILGGAGFADIAINPVDDPVYMGSDAASSFASCRKLGIVAGLLSDLDDRARQDALEALKQTIADHETQDGVLFGSSSWLISAAKAH